MLPDAPGLLNTRILFAHTDACKCLRSKNKTTNKAYQKVLGFDVEQVAEVPKRHWCIAFKSEVAIRMRRGQCTALAENRKKLHVAMEKFVRILPTSATIFCRQHRSPERAGLDRVNWFQ